MAARARSGETSAAMEARPSTRMSSIRPDARRFQVFAGVVPEAQVEAPARHGLLGRLGVPLDLVADGGADEVRAVGVEPVLHQKVYVAEVHVT